MNAQDVFTAAQIAKASGMSRQAIYSGLKKVQTFGDLRDSAAWCFTDMPLNWQMDITRRAVKRGFENGEQFLRALPAAPWKAPVSWDRVPAKEREKAVRLQKAMARALALRADPAISASAVESAGLDDFKAVFGYPISARHWRRLLSRTVERDGTEENWQRLDIYLDDRAFVAMKAGGKVSQNDYQHQALCEVFSQVQDRLHPTAEDRQFLWDAIFRHYECLTEDLPDTSNGNRRRRIVKASIVHYVWQAFPAGTICATEKSLQNRFNEKLVLWRDSGRSQAALRDHRPIKSGNFAKARFEEDLAKIRNLAIQLDGNESLAHRMLRERGELSPAFCETYPYNPRLGKSALHGSIRNAISSDVEMCLPLRRGPWQARMRGPYIPRDWSDVKPGDWFCADDVTWNHYFRVMTPSGQWDVLRGECLLMNDLRTGYPVGFLLIPGKYNGEHVRSLCLRVHDQVGLPRLGYYFEKGVWASRLITGDRRQGTPVHWREAENGLCSSGLGMEVRHATTPRAKPIEGLLRILQERMRCIPGFVGFNERDYDAERIQAQIQRAKHGDKQALLKFPTAEEWSAKISEVLEAFSRDPQNGKMLQGMAPSEAWTEEIARRPLRQLPENARYILSTHQKKVCVRQEGIVLTIRGRRHCYFNEHTGPLIGKDVIAYYNLELPELLTVSDMNRQNYFTVRRVELPAMSATKEQLEEVNQLRKAHMAHAKAIFGEVKHHIVANIVRDNQQSEESNKLGLFVSKETTNGKAAKSEMERKMRKVREKAAAHGIKVTAARNPDEVLDALNRLDYWKRAMKEEASAGHNVHRMDSNKKLVAAKELK